MPRLCGGRQKIGQTQNILQMSSCWHRCRHQRLEEECNKICFTCSVCFKESLNFNENFIGFGESSKQWHDCSCVLPHVHPVASLAPASSDQSLIELQLAVPVKKRRQKKNKGEKGAWWFIVGCGWSLPLFCSYFYLSFLWLLSPCVRVLPIPLLSFSKDNKQRICHQVTGRLCYLSFLPLSELLLLLLFLFAKLSMAFPISFQPCFVLQLPIKI